MSVAVKLGARAKLADLLAIHRSPWDERRRTLRAFLSLVAARALPLAAGVMGCLGVWARRSEVRC